MYRRASSTSVLGGVPSGVYTGGKRVIDGALLEAATRQRLDRSLAIRGVPAPIAYERATASTSSRPVWGIIGATMGLSALFAIGFGNLDSDWAMPPWWSFVLYLGLGLAFGASLLPLLRRRALFGGGARGALRPGRYLFPLDAVDIDVPDVTGRQLVTVRPLGDARRAEIEIDGKRVELVIGFEHGETLRFRLRGDHKGTVALRRLEHAQRLLEDLTYKRGLEEAFTNDLFFDVRVDDAWGRLAPGAAPPPVRAPNVVSLALGRYAPVLLCVIAVSLGGGTFFVRREAGDTALYNHAVAYGSSDAIDRYLARGGLRRLAAEDLKLRLLQAEKKSREGGARETAAAGYGQFDETDEALVDRRCIDALEAHAASAHPKVVPALVRAVQRRARTLFVDVSGTPADMVAAPDVVRDAFANALSEICPASVLRVAGPNVWRERDWPSLSVIVKAQPAGRTWHLKNPYDEPFDVQPMQLEFHATFREGPDELDRFDLTIPPPVEPPVAVRPQSLFAIDGRPLPAGHHDRRVQAAMVASAFDRLYDEIWSLFFLGDPRVPLVPAPVLTP